VRGVSIGGFDLLSARYANGRLLCNVFKMFELTLHARGKSSRQPSMSLLK